MRKKIPIIILAILTLTTLFLGNLYFNKHLEEKNAFSSEHYNKLITSSIDEDSKNQKKVKWINNALINQVIEKPNKEITESEFLVLLYKAYNKEPSIANTSKFWAAGYYKNASLYKLPLLKDKQRENSITVVHAAEIIAAIQGENESGDEAIKYMYNNDYINMTQYNMAVKPNNKLTRVQAVSIINTLLKKGYFLFQKINTNNKKEIVALGDSISMGWGITDSTKPSNYGFPDLIEKMNDIYHIYNLSARGLLTKNLLEHLKTPSFQLKIKKAEVIFVNIGSGDLLQSSQVYLEKVRDKNGASPSLSQITGINSAKNDVENNIDKIILSLRQYSNAPILLFSLYNPIPKDVTGNTFASNILEDINKHFKNLTEKYDSIYYIDSYNEFKGKENIYVINSDIHPTYEGQKVLARLGINKLKSLGL